MTTANKTVIKNINTGDSMLIEETLHKVVDTGTINKNKFIWLDGDFAIARKSGRIRRYDIAETRRGKQLHWTKKLSNRATYALYEDEVKHIDSADNETLKPAKPDPTYQQPEPAFSETPKPTYNYGQHDNDSLNEVESLRKALQTLIGAQPMDESRVIELITQHAPTDSRSITINTGVDLPEIKIDSPHKQFESVLTMVENGLNVMLVGDCGTGKTTLAQQIAESYELEFYCQSALDDKAQLLGFVGASGDVIRTPFREAIEHGGVFLLDEIDGSNPNVLIAMNSALENGFVLFPDGMVEVHVNFIALAAANTFCRGANKKFIGRYPQDKAAIDRWAFEILEIDNDIERSMSDDQSWYDRVVTYRRVVSELELDVIVSPRATRNGAKLLASGLSVDEVEHKVLWKGLDKQTINKIKFRAGV